MKIMCVVDIKRTFLLVAFIAMQGMIGNAVFALPRAEQKEELEKVTIMLDWFVNPNHAGFVIANQMGFFEEEGLDVRLLEPADPADPPKLSALKKVDYAVNYQNTLQMQAAEKWDNVRVASVIDTTLQCLIVLKESGILNISDLKGKRIGYSIPGFDEVILHTMLARNGVGIDEVTLVNINWALTSSLITKKVDAVIGAFRNFELHELDIEGHPGTAFYPEEHGVPMYDDLILITHKDNARSNTTKKVLRALEKSVKYIREYPQESQKIFVEYKPDVLDSDLNRRAWDDTIPLLADRPNVLDKEKYRSFARYLEDNNMVTHKIPSVESYAIDPLQ